MKGKLKTSSIVAGALLAIQLYAGVATAGQPTSVWGAWTLTANQTLGQTLAALDTGDNPRCGKDGACNLAVCSADEDPDCRDLDLPPGAGADPATTMNRYPSRPSDVMDCTSKETTEIAAAVDWGAEKGIGSINGIFSQVQKYFPRKPRLLNSVNRRVNVLHHPLYETFWPENG